MRFYWRRAHLRCRLDDGREFTWLFDRTWVGPWHRQYPTRRRWFRHEE